MPSFATASLPYVPDVAYYMDGDYAYGYLVLMAHEDDWRRVDSTSLVVCRHCGQVKPFLGWSSQCWRWVSTLQGAG